MRLILAVDGGVLIASVAGVLLVFVMPLAGAADAALRADIDWGRIERRKTWWVLGQVFLFPMAAYYFAVVRPELMQSVRERRRTQTVYRPPRSRREVGTAIACAATILIVTSALVWVLRPRDDDSSDVPPIESLPPELTGEIPPELSIPTESIPADTTPSTAVPAP